MNNFFPSLLQKRFFFSGLLCLSVFAFSACGIASDIKGDISQLAPDVNNYIDFELETAGYLDSGDSVEIGVIAKTDEVLDRIDFKFVDTLPITLANTPIVLESSIASTYELKKDIFGGGIYFMRPLAGQQGKVFSVPTKIATLSGTYTGTPGEVKLQDDFRCTSIGGVSDSLNCGSGFVLVGEDVTSMSVGGPEKVTFEVVEASDEDQEVTYAVEAPFWVSDMDNTHPGYRAYIELSDLTHDNGGAVIASEDVSLEVDGVVTTLEGDEDSNVVSSSATLSLGDAVKVIERSVASSGGSGKYGVSPSFTVTVPAKTPTGKYTGKILFTLVKN